MDRCNVPTGLAAGRGSTCEATGIRQVYGRPWPWLAGELNPTLLVVALAGGQGLVHIALNASFRLTWTAVYGPRIARRTWRREVGR
jgi:hypothetical protein